MDDVGSSKATANIIHSLPFLGEGWLYKPIRGKEVG